MINDNALKNFEKWSHDYRGQLEPAIRQRFYGRGQSDADADQYIADCCWDHPWFALAKLRDRDRCVPSGDRITFMIP